MTRSALSMLVQGVYCGLFVGICAWAGLPYFALEASRAALFTFALLGAAFGAWLSGQRSELRVWCGGMTILAGCAGVIAGFGSVAYYGRSPQVASFVMFVSGPYGAIIGAILGLAIWVGRKARARSFHSMASPSSIASSGPGPKA